MTATTNIGFLYQVCYGFVLQTPISDGAPHCLAVQPDFLTPARCLHDSQLTCSIVQHPKHTIESIIIVRKVKKG